MRVSSGHTAPAQMIREPGSLGAPDQGFESLQVLPVDRLRRSKVHRDTVLNHSILFKDLVENLQRPPAVDHVILGDYFKPAHDRFLRKNMAVMRHGKSYYGSE